jgi:hypothetical protein
VVVTGLAGVIWRFGIAVVVVLDLLIPGGVTAEVRRPPTPTKEAPIVLPQQTNSTTATAALGLFILVTSYRASLPLRLKTPSRGGGKQ